MAEPAAEAQPQVPRPPEANVVRDIVVDPAPAQAVQDANVQEVMLCPFFCSFGFAILYYIVSTSVFATFIKLIPYTFALVFPA